MTAFELLAPEHVAMMIATAVFVASVALAVGILLFTYVNKRILKVFMDEVRIAQNIGQQALIAEDRMLQETATKARSAILEAFLAEQRQRDLATHREIESLSTAMSIYNGRLRTVEQERFPRLESRVLELEGQVQILQHPSLKKLR